METTEVKKDLSMFVDWENPPQVEDLKRDYQEASTHFSLQVSKINNWLELLEGNLSVKIPKGRSKIQPKLVRKQAEWRYTALSEPFLSDEDLFDVRPAGYKDRNSAYYNELILNKQINKDIDKVQFIDEYIRTVTNEGTVILKVGWETEEKEVEELEEEIIYASPEEGMAFLQRMVESGNMTEEEAQAYIQSGKPIVKDKKKQKIKKTVETINRPTVEICDYNNVIIDPSCKGNIKKAKFIIHRFETDPSTLEKDGRYKNLDKIDFSDNSALNDPDYPYDENHTFSFKDRARKNVVVYEYWGYYDIHNKGIVEPFVASYIGDTMIRLEEYPFPFERLPFITVPYMPVKNSIYGEPDAELLEDNQRVLGAVTRGVIDLLGRSANGQSGVQKDALDLVNFKKFVKGEDFKFNPHIDPNRAFYTGKYPEIPRSAIELMTMQNNEAESLTGVKAFNSGITGEALGNSVGGIRSALDATAKRELSILRRLSNGLIQMAEMFTAMNAIWLSDKEVVRITDEEFVPIERSSLSGEFDIKLSISTPEVEDMKAKELSYMLQTLGNSIPFEMTQTIMADLLRLRKRPQLAKTIEEYKPEPDQAEQMTKQLEIEKLKAELFNEKQKGLENQADIGLKTAKTLTEQAQAKKTSSEADLKDMEFVRKGKGIEHDENMEKELLKEQNKINLSMLEEDRQQNQNTKGEQNEK